MKRAFLTTLSVLSMSAFMATAAVAESRTIQQNITIASASSTATKLQILPNGLVSLAYQGHFNSQGIPGYSKLLNAYSSGRVSARDLIQVAINTGRLPAETLSNGSYLRNVEFQLASLSKS
jgi:hypothetical protein